MSCASLHSDVLASNNQQYSTMIPVSKGLSDFLWFIIFIKHNDEKQTQYNFKQYSSDEIATVN